MIGFWNNTTIFRWNTEYVAEQQRFLVETVLLSRQSQRLDPRRKRRRLHAEQGRCAIGPIDLAVGLGEGGGDAFALPLLELGAREHGDIG